MARQNKDIEILVKLASQGNFDQAQEQLQRLKAAQEGVAAKGADGIGRLQEAWKTWTTLSEVSATRIKNAFLTAMGPIGAIIVIVETVIRTFGRLISFVRDYQKSQDELNKSFAEASKAIADANKNKEKYADAKGLDALGAAIKAHEEDLKKISKSHDEIAEKLKKQQETTLGITWALASTTRQMQEQVWALVQQRVETERQLEAKREQIEAEKELTKKNKEREAAETEISNRLAKLTLDETAFKERELEKQLEAYARAGVDKAALEELRMQETLRIEDESDAKRQEMEAKLASRLELASMDDLDRQRLKLEQEIADYEEAGVKKTLIDELRSSESKRIDDLELARKKKQNAFLKALESEEGKASMQMLSDLATFKNSKNKEMAAIGQAAAFSMNLIETMAGATKAFSALANIPVVGPVLGTAAAAAAVAAGTARGAVILGAELEEGGVVQQETIVKVGEKGRAEGVIPLRDPRAMKMVGEAISSAGGVGGGETNIYLTVNATLDWREIMNKLAEEALAGNAEIVALARRLGDLNELHAGRAG